MKSIENHLDVYVDANGLVCMAQASMDEECEVALELEEARRLVTRLSEAVDQAAAMRAVKEQPQVQAVS
jgi:hypothetical protein